MFHLFHLRRGIFCTFLCWMLSSSISWLGDSRLELHAVPLLDHVTERCVYQSLLSEHAEPAEALRANVDKVHGPAPARYVLHHQLRGRELGHHAVPDSRLPVGQGIGLRELLLGYG